MAPRQDTHDSIAMVIEGQQESDGSLGKSSSAYEIEHTKPGFMSRVKGEVKILQGRMTKNEGKMEEGRKMKGSL